MKRLLVLVCLLASCDSRPPSAAGRDANGDRLTFEDLQAREPSHRTRFEGQSVYTIKCDLFWHASRECPKMDLYRSSFPVTTLLLEDGILMEEDALFRDRLACPHCVRG